MQVKWLQALIDLPGEGFEAASRFWTSVTASATGDIHPDHPEFIHLNPASGDMHLELQRIDDGPPSVHLDLLVEDIAAAVDRAITLGATLVAYPGHAVLRTPGGVPFCFVPWSGESERAPSIDPALEHGVDQICIDVADEHFDADVTFWSALTGWEVNPARFAEFRSFDQPETLPLRVLIQRLGDHDHGGRAHLDFSCGTNVDAVAERHRAAGASVVERFEHWTLMRDPAGLRYCLTTRRPNLG